MSVIRELFIASALAVEGVTITDANVNGAAEELGTGVMKYVA